MTSAEDSGTVGVATDDALLSGKVQTESCRDGVLLLLPDALVCREFATSREVFRYPVASLLETSMSDLATNEWYISVLARHPADGVLGSQKIVLRCASPEDAFEWIELLRSVLTDRNIRKVQEDEDVERKATEAMADALMELQQMFPNLDDSLLQSILTNHHGDLARAIDQCLSLTDSSFQLSPREQAPPLQPPRTTTSAVQLAEDELFAQILQDQLFMEQLQQNEEVRQAFHADEGASQQHSSGAAGSFNFTEKIQQASDATKRKLSELYRKFKGHSDERQQQEQEEEGQELLDMRASKGHYSNRGDDDDDDDDDEREQRGGKSDILNGEDQPAVINLLSDVDDDEPLLEDRRQAAAKPAPSATSASANSNLHYGDDQGL